MRNLALATLILLAACRPPGPAPTVTSPSQHDHGGHDHGGHVHGGNGTALAPLLEGLGALHHPVTTSSPRAQRFFDQGLRLTYAFNHTEALRAFREAARLDPDCAMAHWGQALALGPNINDAMPAEREEQALTAIRAAQARAGGASDSEQAYIAALATRYGTPAGENREARNAAYTDAMQALATHFPTDADALTLYGAAIMNQIPWDYWETPDTPRAPTRAAIATLEAAIAVDPDHPGAHHYYIHIVEASSDPDRAEPSSDRLAALMPGAGHLVHMPAHIYVRVGRYADAVDANVEAIAADEDYIAQCRAQGLYPVGYYPHNVHFLWYAATEGGERAVALDAARKTGTKAPHDQLHDYVMLRDFLVAPMQALARFGRWDEILALPEPDDPFARGVWHHVRSLALTAHGRLADAEADIRALDAVIADPATAPLMAGWGAVPAPTVLQIARAVSVGRLAARRGRFDEAIVALHRGVALQDDLPYNEPPTWHQPLRHILGAILLDAGRADEAETVYRKDLEDHRENGWALFGLLQSLRVQAKEGEAEETETRFRKAWRRADFTLTASQF